TRPIERYLDAAVRRPSSRGPARDDPGAVAAFRAAQGLPYRMAGYQALACAFAGVAVVLLGRRPTGFHPLPAGGPPAPLSPRAAHGPAGGAGLARGPPPPGGAARPAPPPPRRRDPVAGRAADEAGDLLRQRDGLRLGAGAPVRALAHGGARHHGGLGGAGPGA